AGRTPRERVAPRHHRLDDEIARAFEQRHEITHHHGVAERLLPAHDAAADGRLADLAVLEPHLAHAEVDAHDQCGELRRRGQASPPPRLCGSTMVKHAPCPGGLVALIVPPWLLM